MSERFPRRPLPEARRASESAVDRGTRAEEQGPEISARDLARPHSLERLGHHRLPPQDTHTEVVRGTDREISSAQHPRETAPAVRIDMDLELDITLRAKIKGEIELSILYVAGSRPSGARASLWRREAHTNAWQGLGAGEAATALWVAIRGGLDGDGKPWPHPRG
jgi:hypothetical protein